MAVLRRWLEDQFGCSLEALLELPPESVDVVIAAHVQHLYNGRAPVSHARVAVAALQALRPRLRGEMARSWGAVAAWQLQEPTIPHIPMPLLVVRALAAAAIALGWPRTGLLWLTMFHALLRPGEGVGLRRMHLALPDDGVVARGTGVVSIFNAKTANRGRHFQAVVLEDPALVQVLQRVFGGLQPQQLLCPGGNAAVSARFYAALQSLGLRESGYTLRSLRAGGATDHFETVGNITATQFRGRWDRPETLNHYVQQALSVTAFSRIPAECRPRLAALSRLLGRLLCEIPPATDLQATPLVVPHYDDDDSDPVIPRA